MKYLKRNMVKGVIILVVSYVLFVLLVRINQMNNADPAPEFSDLESSVRVYLVKLEDDGQIGEKIGCGDSLVPVSREVSVSETMIEPALSELFALTAEEVSEEGLYNALSSSQLVVERVTIKNGNAKIYLTGSFSIGGVCDAPRVKSQITKTVLQFPNVTSAEIYINGVAIDEVLSGK